MLRMKRLTPILVVIAVLVAVLVAAPASAYYKRCGDMNFVSDIGVRNMSCATAKRYIRNWYSRGKPMPRSFTCRLRSAPSRARCRSGSKAFGFVYGE